MIIDNDQTIATILDTVPAMIMVMGVDGRIIEVNRACEKITGFSAAQLTDYKLSDLFTDDGHDGEDKPLSRYLSAMSPDNGTVIFDKWLKTSSHELRLINFSLSGSYDENGTLNSLIGCGTDNTAKRAVEESEKRHILELYHMSRHSLMGEMATEIAHELNQPLAVINTSSDVCKRMLERGVWTPDELVEILQDIGEQTQRAAETIKELRRFSSGGDANRVVTNINVVIDEVRELIAIESRFNHIELDIRLEPELPWVCVDTIQINQVILNLVRNAIDAMKAADNPDQGSHKMSMTISTSAHQMVEVLIRDSGTGVSANSVGKIFNPFYTTKQNRSGMGLAISRSIIENHGGELTFSNNIDRGATFYFALPIHSREENCEAG